MSNYIELNGKIAFHPGYYLKEIIEESGLTQEDFARRLGTTPKNISVLVHGEQSLSIDIASKLSRMLGTSVQYWLNIQQSYDEMVAERLSFEELKREREVFKHIDYKYFRENFGLPNYPRKVDLQIEATREKLGVSSLSVLKEEDLAVNFRSSTNNLSESNIINANVMVQIAINETLKADLPKYNKKKFENAVEFALTQTKNHEGFLPLVSRAFNDAGVMLVVLPNLKNSGINGATKKVGSNIMLMVNDRRHYADTFWFTMLHEAGHILKGDYGITVEGSEEGADEFAKNKLIPPEAFELFIEHNKIYNVYNIKEFADSINQDPGIVYGRLQKEGKIPFSETNMAYVLRHTYNVVTH